MRAYEGPLWPHQSFRFGTESTTALVQMGGCPHTLALAGRVLISWMRKVSGFTMMTRGMPVVCCTQHTSPGWFITSDHWHSAGDVLLPPLDLQETEHTSAGIQHTAYNTWCPTTASLGFVPIHVWDTEQLLGRQSINVLAANKFCFIFKSYLLLLEWTKRFAIIAHVLLNLRLPPPQN